MFWVGVAIIGLMFLILGGMFFQIIRNQKRLDIPCSGVLIVDRQDPESKCLVYLQVNVDPESFTEGQEVKLKVATIIDDSQ